MKNRTNKERGTTSIPRETQNEDRNGNGFTTVEQDITAAGNTTTKDMSGEQIKCKLT